MSAQRTEVRLFTNLFVGNSKDKETYIDSLVVSLSRLGYPPYFDIDGNICFVVPDTDSLTSIKQQNEEKDISDNIL